MMGTQKAKRRSTAFHNPGVKGRATGITVKNKLVRDEDGLAGLNDFYDDSSDDSAESDADDEDFDDEDEEEEASVDEENLDDRSVNESLGEPPVEEDPIDDEVVPESVQHPLSLSVRTSSTRKSSRKSVSSASTPAQTTPIKKLDFTVDEVPPSEGTPEFSMPADGSDGEVEFNVDASAQKYSSVSKDSARRSRVASARAPLAASTPVLTTVAAPARASSTSAKRDSRSKPSAQKGTKKTNKGRKKAPTETRSARPVDAPRQEEFEPVDNADDSTIGPLSTYDAGAPRRSTRTKLTPCAYWKNERVVYEPEESTGVFRAKGKIKPKTPALPVRAKRKQRRTARPSKAKKLRRSATTDEDEHSVEELDEQEEERIRKLKPPPVLVKVQDWKENPGSPDIEMNVFKTPAMLQFTELPGLNLSVCKIFNFDDQRWASGVLELKPNSTKPSQSTKTNFLIFYVVSAQVDLTIHETKMTLPAGSCFFVPPGNYYNLRNTSQDRKCKLIFTQIKVGPVGGAQRAAAAK
eukprot:m.455385 g.455385  ORF g.455385 m.455385 type:complete len:522 (+) comp21572_c1_seq2:289-1854(+)